MVEKINVKANFPSDMSIIEKEMANVLAEIIIERYGKEKSKLIAIELERAFKNKN